METYLAALALGLAHGLEPDHLATVSVLVLRGAGARASALAGLRFGLAHVGVLFVAGVLAIALNVALTEEAARVAEIVSGAVLLLLGLACLLGAGRARLLHAHAHEHGGSKHAHLHVHDAGDHHGHSHLTFALGGLFAIGGARTVLLVGLPALGAGSPGGAALAVLAFGAGIFLSMTLSGVVLSRLARFAKGRGPSAFAWATRGTGLVAATIGGIWLIRSLVE